jgi:hypothetical protein
MRTITIKLEGFGGELNVGKLDVETAGHLKEKADGDYANIVKDENEMAEFDLPTYSQINDLLSLNNITTNDCEVLISDEEGNLIFKGDLGDLETDYCGDYNQESIIAVSGNPDEHDFATEIVDTPILYSFSSGKGTYFTAEINLADDEAFELEQVAVVVNEVKINTDDDTIFGYDFITEVRYKDEVLENISSDTLPYNFIADIVEP